MLRVAGKVWLNSGELERRKTMTRQNMFYLPGVQAQWFVDFCNNSLGFKCTFHRWEGSGGWFYFPKEADTEDIRSAYALWLERYHAVTAPTKSDG